MPDSPSSPMMPPHSVLSRSVTTTLRVRPVSARTCAICSSASAGKRARGGMLPRPMPQGRIVPQGAADLLHDALGVQHRDGRGRCVHQPHVDPPDEPSPPAGPPRRETPRALDGRQVERVLHDRRAGARRECVPELHDARRLSPRSRASSSDADPSEGRSRSRHEGMMNVTSGAKAIQPAPGIEDLLSVGAEQSLRSSRRAARPGTRRP
jgi:hypothetical protein